MKSVRIAAAAGVAAGSLSFCALAATSVVRVTFTPTGVIDMVPTGLSDDGTTVVGTGPFGVPNLLYTEAAGASVIGDGCTSGLPAISGDGSTIAACNIDVNGSWNSAKWLGGTSWLDLGSEAGAMPCDAFLSGPWALDQDGSLLTGLLWKAQVCQAGAGVWDLIAGGPATPLAGLVPGRASRGNAISDDGTVVAGWQDDAFGARRAAKWVNGAGQFITNGTLDYLGEALAMSGDGRTIVGVNHNGGRAGWIWREGEGIWAISSKADGDFVPIDVSDNGRTVVGLVRDPVTGFAKAFIWSQGKGVTLIEDYLHDRHVDVPPGWTFNVASLISPDGHLIYGWGVNPDGYIEMFKIDNSAASLPSIVPKQ